MSANYKLKSGQINFENTNHSGSFSCVVIKDGEFFNLTDDLRQMLIDALTKPQDKDELDLEDMF